MNTDYSDMRIIYIHIGITKRCKIQRKSGISAFYSKIPLMLVYRQEKIGSKHRNFEFYRMAFYCLDTLGKHKLIELASKYKDFPRCISQSY